MVSTQQYTLYSIAAVPIVTTLISTLVFKDIMLIMLIDFFVVIALAIVAEKQIPKGPIEPSEEFHWNKLDYQPKKKIKANFTILPMIVVAVLSVLGYVLWWIAGLSFEDVFYTLEPHFHNTFWKWFYWVVFFFLFSTAYCAIESKFYYSDILQNLEGNYLQGLIVGVLAWAKAIIIILVTVNYEPWISIWMISFWLLMNLAIGYSAWGNNYTAGSLARQLAYIFILVGWILLINNPWDINRRPLLVLTYHPKNIFGGE